MSLESTSKLRNNIKDLKQKVDHQEKVVSGYQANYDNLRNEVKLLLKLVEINKKLEHETKPEEITKLNNQKQEIFNKIPMMIGRDEAFISQAIRDREISQEQIHTKIDAETKILNDFKTELKDNTAMESKRPLHSISRSGRNWILGVTGAGVIGLAALIANSEILSGKNKDKNKDGTEQTTPVAPPKDTPKADEKDKVKEKPDNRADYRDGLDKNKNKETGKRRKVSPPEKQRDGSPNVEYRITNPDGTKEKTFNKKEERDEFIKDHGLILNENSTTVKTSTPKVEWKLTSPDGKQTKTFNTKAERDAFAQAHGLHVNE
jgi:hypothetical protein